MSMAGLILCGGQSTRMGRDKATLPLFGETMLQRMVRILQSACTEVLIVAANAQNLPSLPDEVLVVRDGHPQRGPLQGLCDGMGALPEDATGTFVCGCDLPLLQPAFVQELTARLGDHEIAVPSDDRGVHPLAAVYRRSVLPTIETLLAGGQRRMSDLLAACDTLEVPADNLRAVDPELHSLLNCNAPEDYEVVLEIIRQTARE